MKKQRRKPKGRQRESKYLTLKMKLKEVASMIRNQINNALMFYRAMIWYKIWLQVTGKSALIIKI